MEEEKDFGKRSIDKHIYDIEGRVSRLETKQETMCDDITEIRGIMGYVATKTDLDHLRCFFENRDEYWTKNLWWLIKAFAVIMGLIVLAAFGIDKIPSLFL